MTSINQYATRTFAEHPIALWPLDDDVSYISLIADSVRDLSNVTTGHWAHDGTVSVVTAQDAPFKSSDAYYRHTSGLTLTSTSPNLFGPSALGTRYETFHVGAYVKFDSPVVSYTVSCFYNGDTALIDSETFTGAPVGEWLPIGSTFIPRTGFTGVQFKLDVEFLDITSGSGYGYAFNGLTVGQRSEPTCNKSLGVAITAIDSGTGIPAALGRAVNGSPVLEYGIGGHSGYFMMQGNNLLATNYGIPLVYGSDNATRLRPSDDETGLSKLPSVVLPGMGIFNDLGKHNDYTFEVWLRVKNNSATSLRIFGPLASNDGIYVKDGFMSLVVGDQIASHPVSEWYRPMILHIVFSKNSISMLINGERVASVSYNAQIAAFPVGTDWLGFYCYADTQPFEIDSVSIFPYAIDTTVALRKFVWGQGIEFPELSNSAFGGSPLAIDYAYANMSANFSYPDYARFESGYADNLSLSNGAMSVPNYDLPTIVTGAKTTKQLYADSATAWNGTGPTFVTFRADSSWRDPCYMSYGSLDVLSTQVNGVYGIFNSPSMTGVLPLLHFVDKSNGNRFQIDLSATGPSVTYTKIIGGVTTQLASKTISFGTVFAVGVNFQTLLSDKSLAAFFNNRKNIQVYVGGNGVDTFVGKIERVGFMSASDMPAHAGHFDGKGFATIDGMAYYDTVAYTLLPLSEYNQYFLDIAVKSYWEEYYPMSYFAAYTNDPFGNTKYDVDFLQFNIGVPSTKTPVSTYFDTTGSPVHAFVTFQRISAGANKSLDTFTTGVPLAQNSVLDVRKTTGLATKAFEVLDNTVIYPPSSMPLHDTAIVLHLAFIVKGIKSNPLVIRTMSLISKSLDYDKFNAVGTKFGLPMYPYSKFGNYYSPRPENPFTVYKGSTPHLYLTDNSGVRSIQLDSQPIESGINVPVNAERKQGYQMSAMQIWVKYSDLVVPSTAKTLFSVESSDRSMDFNVVTDGSSDRMVLTSADTGLRFYQDGAPVIHPYIERDIWTAIGIDFIPSLEFSDVGSINLMPGAFFNNIVYYKASALQMEYINVYRYWEQVRHSVVDGSDIAWSAWESDTWDKVWKLSSNTLGISIDNIYKSYVGTNRVVVDDGAGVLFSGSDTVMLAGESFINGGIVVTDNPLSWYSIVRKPV